MPPSHRYWLRRLSLVTSVVIGYIGCHWLRRLPFVTSVAVGYRELKDDQPEPSALSSVLGCLPCFQAPVLLTQVIVMKAFGLKGKKESSSEYHGCSAHLQFDFFSKIR